MVYESRLGSLIVEMVGSAVICWVAYAADSVLAGRGRPHTLRTISSRLRHV